MSTAALPDAFLRAIAEGFPPDFLTREPSELAEYGRDWTRVYTPAPSAVAFPRTHGRGGPAAARCATRTAWRWCPRAGARGSRRARWRPEGELVLSLQRMRRMDPVDLLGNTVRVQAGAVTEAVHQHCAQHGLTWPVDFASKGSSHGGRQHRHQRGRGEGHPLRAHAPVGARAPGGDGAGAGARAQRRAGEEQHGRGSAPALHRQRGHAGRHHRGDAQAHPAARQAGRVPLRGAGRGGGAAAVPRRARRRRCCCRPTSSSPTSAWRACSATASCARPSRRPAAATCCSRPRPRTPTAVEAWLGSLFERGLVTDGTLAQSASQAAELWALREGISESLSATGLPHKNDIALPVAALEAFCAELESVLRRALPGLGDLPLRPHRRRQPARQRDEAGRAGEGGVPGAHQAGRPRPCSRWCSKHGGSISAEHGIGLLKKDYLAYSRTPAELALLRALKRALDPERHPQPGQDPRRLRAASRG